MATILCVDDDPLTGRAIEASLKRLGHTPIVVTGVPDAMRRLESARPDLIVSDFQMPGINGLDFLAVLERDGWEVPLIMLTGHASIDHAVQAMKAGAVDYLAKPFEHEQMEIAVNRALTTANLRRENEAMKQEVTEFRSRREILGSSSSLAAVLQTASMAARTKATVLLQGESGTGKELFARTIHDQSDRRDQAFIKLNCAALPEGLIESALFGHEKGAFTGAMKRVAGAFERAHNGTLLLDEITEMRVDLQSKLLRVLQEQEFERVGGSAPIEVDVRIIATTNRDLATEVATGNFRQDLYYRLSVLPIRIPPLRERRDDIPLLATRFAMNAAVESGREFGGFPPDALEYLQSLEWPGNVRELQHAVERAVIMGTNPVITAEALGGIVGGQSTSPTGASSTGASSTGASSTGAASTGASSTGASSTGASSTGATSAAREVPDGAVVLTSLDIAGAERALIRRALEVSEGNRTHAAKLLGMSVRTLRSKLNTGDSDLAG